MERMKTFGLYALGILGFIFLSFTLEDALLKGMYKPLSNIGEFVPTSSEVSVQVESATSSRNTGYMDFKVTNNSSEKITDKYVRLDLYSKQGLLAKTEYIKIDDLEPGESKNYKVKFKGTEISKYNIATLSESEVPDKSYVLDFFGFEVDLTNVFGLDISNSKIFGKRVKDMFNTDKLDGAKGKVRTAWGWAKNYVRAVPWWGYLIGGLIVTWYLPTGYVFGIF